MRVCVGCELLRPKKELLRVVVSLEGEFSIDKTGKKAGRGAYICPTGECFEKAYTAKRLERSLKKRVPKEVYDALQETLQYEER